MLTNKIFECIIILYQEKKMPSPIQFTQNDVSNIINAFGELKNSHFLFQKIAPTIDNKFIQEKILKKQNHFQILINDGLSQQDKIAKETDCLCGIDFCENAILRIQKNEGLSYEQALNQLKEDFKDKILIYLKFFQFDIECWGPKNVPMDQFRTFLTSHIVIKSNIQSNQNYTTYFEQNPTAAHELARKIFIITSFAFEGKETSTQKQFNAYQLNFEKQWLLAQIKEIEKIPFIHLVEHTRNFLFNALIQNHALDLASSVEDARKLLKENKDLIFKTAEQYHYINNADKMIKWHQLRDELGHPERVEQKTPFPQDLSEIFKDFRNVLNNLLHTKNIQIEISHNNRSVSDIQDELLKKYHKPFQVLNEKDATIKLKSVPDMMAGYGLIKSMDALEKMCETIQLPLKSNGKEISGRKKWDYLGTINFFDKKNIPLIEENNKYRNEIAHGTSNALTYQEIEKRRIAFNKMINDIIERQDKKFFGKERD